MTAAEVQPGGAARHREHLFPGRGRRITLRLSDEEHAAVAAAAQLAGLTLAGYGARAALAAARGGEPPTQAPLRDALAELMLARTQVRRFGTNVNQAVAALHATGSPPPALLAAVDLTARAVVRLDEAAEAVTRRARGSRS